MNRPNRSQPITNRRFLFRLLLSSFLIGTLLQGQDAQPGESLFGRNDYIEYKVGNLPFILTSGHGGSLTPSEIADRTWGTLGRDTNTRELTLAIAAEIAARGGRYPHVIINHLHRRKLDPNREIVEASQGDPYSEIAWHDFHGFIQDAREAAANEFGFGFLVDIHGHGHTIQRVELGYGMGATQLNLSDSTLERPGYAWNSSIRTLALANPGKAFPHLLRGPGSLGDLFNLHGLPAWPSPDFPSIGNAPFFNGGYITRTHGSMLDNGVINAVQAECYYAGLRDNAANRANTARVFADTFQKFFWDNYGYNLGSGPLYRLAAEKTEISKGDPTMYIQVVRDGYRSLSSSIEFELGGTAVLGVDYLFTPAVVQFSNGQESSGAGLRPLPANGDTGDKTIEIRLKPDATQAADTTPIIITLGDGASQTVRVEALAPEAVESDGAISFRVSRTKTDAPETVAIEWDGTAVAGADYFLKPALPESVTFASGASEEIISVRLMDDGIIEQPKTITLRVLPADGYFVGHLGEATVHLRDDDGPAGLLAWYPGAVEDNRVVDVSGNARHATTLPAGRGPAAIDAEGGLAIDFDGVEGVAGLPKFELDSSEGFTIAFRFRLPNGFSGEQTILGLGDRGAPGSVNIFLPVSSVLRTLPVDANGTGTSLDAIGAWTNGNWHHYALIVDSSGALRIYANGNLMRTRFNWTGPLDPNEIIWLGWRRRSGTSSGHFSGQLQDFRIYNRGLAASEISALASGRLTFDSWRRNFNIPEEATPESDLNGNGASLLLEYGLGANPLTSSPLPGYSSSVSEGRASLQFLHHTGAGDLRWTVEATDSLADESWTPLAQKLPGDVTWTLSPGSSLEAAGDRVTVFDGEPADEFEKRFLRLRVDLNPEN